MGASALHLVPRRHRVGSIGSTSLTMNQEAWILVGVAAGSVVIPIAIASALGAGLITMAIVGIGAFVLLMPVAVFTVGMHLEES